MHLIQYLFRLIDSVFRIRNYLRRKIAGGKPFSRNSNESDSQATFYQSVVSKINSDPKAMRRFRRIYDYREILEHVDYSLGRKYLQHINKNGPQIWNHINRFKKNDLIGKPRKFNFEKIGNISPTTLRYIAVATDIKKIFGDRQFERIAEIGGGYGGQAGILSQLNAYQEYYIFDLPEVQDLTRRFLLDLEVKNLFYPNIRDLDEFQVDLVISNYAFSELPRKEQDKYLEKVILKAKNGFMLMNSGLTNKTGRSDGKISLAELQVHIPTLRILPETPLTSPDNYLLVWTI